MLRTAAQRLAADGFHHGWVDFASGLPTEDHVHVVLPDTCVLYSDVNIYPLTITKRSERAGRRSRPSPLGQRLNTPPCRLPPQRRVTTVFADSTRTRRRRRSMFQSRRRRVFAGVMMGAVLSVMGVGCSSTRSAKVDESWLARVPEGQLGDVREARKCSGAWPRMR